MLHLLRLIFCLLSLTLVSNFSPLNAQTGFESSVTLPDSDPVSISLLSEEKSLEAGKPSWIALKMDIDDHWHAYWKNPGDAGMAPVVTWNLPQEFEVSELQWPTPTLFRLSSAVGLGYEGQVILLAKITPPSTFTGNADISADIRWVVCSDETCLPGETHAALSLPVAAQLAEKDNNQLEIFQKARTKLPLQAHGSTAERQEKGVVLSFQAPLENDALEEVLFFPEQKNTIDYTSPLAVTTAKEDPTQHFFTLKEVKAPTEKTALKGILVLKSSSYSLSYSIDLLIQDNGPEIISMTPAIENVNETAALIEETPASDPFEFQGGLPLALLFAFLGGMILNLMPCVLPVISLKVLSFVKLAGEKRALVFQHGLAFSLGVLLSFWVLAGALLALQAYGHAVGWGFQLQEPIFVAVLATGLLIFALSLFGLFEMGTSLISAAGNAQKKRGLFASLTSGVLATAVATPCTGPFLGSAVGFAVTLPAPQAMLIFTFLGLGMSFPYLILAAFPSLLRFIPKAGNWMIAFKELMGFFMLATVLWLVWIFGAETNEFSLSLLLAGFFFVSLACWVYGRFSSPLKPRPVRYTSMLVAAAIFSLGGYSIVTASSLPPDTEIAMSDKIESHGNQDWEEFSVERVKELQAQGVPVFIDFTAKWCLVCQTNHVVLTTEEVSKEFDEKGVVRMKADWTRNDPEIAAELRKFGRNSVPLYVLYNGSKEQPEILPQVLTPQIVIDSLQKL